MTAVVAGGAPSGGRRRVTLAVALVIVALNLRIAIAAVSPVLGAIQHDSGLTSTGGGVLTTVPVVCFGVFALLSPTLIRRFGMSRLLALSMVGLTAGVAVRLIPSTIALFAGTALLGGAIAVGNVLLPGLIKRDFPDHVGVLTGLYSMALFGGAAISAGTTVPLERALHTGWRPTIGLWGGTALIALAAWAPHARRGDAGRVPGSARIGEHIGGLWGDPVARAVAAFMGLQSLGYYAALSWIPTLLQDHGMAAGRAGWMLSFSSFPGLLASLVTPTFARRFRRQWGVVIVGVVLCLAAFAGLITDPVPLAYLWMLLLGLGQGVAISLALSFIVLRSPDTAHTAQLSTMAQGAGYLIAAVGPFGLGAIHDLTGGWTVPVAALLVLLVPQLVAGVLASLPRHVLDPVRGGAHDDWAPGVGAQVPGAGAGPS